MMAKTVKNTLYAKNNEICHPSHYFLENCMPRLQYSITKG